MGIKKIGLLGGRGFVGQEILLLLEQHEQIEVVSIFSSSQSGQPVNSNAARSLIYQDLKIDSLNLSDEDGFIIALPNNESKPYIDLILKHNPNTIFVDISSDHRFDSDWEYRIPELSGPVSSTRISNPGCYASAMQFMLAPLITKLAGPVNLFGISGYSGAGASPNPRNNKELLKENIIPYSLVSHLHEREVQAHSYREVLFTPSVGDFFRGILITGNFTLSEPMSSEDACDIFKNFYQDKDLIKVQDSVPNLQEVRESSVVIIGGFEVDIKINRLTFCCVLDNLLKGAATQAIQNLNSAFGWNDNLGIIK
jgi:N-acetyl-gamma-glutamyl-phosphate reductase common form|tara:strand:- start:683 stop:1615 length:933 start_codon:yes stop_codon:yes gene_type:complete